MRKQETYLLLKRRFKDKKIRRQVGIFFVCLVLSFTAWILQNFSNESISSITFPVVYTHIPKDKVLMNGANQKLAIRISANNLESLLSYREIDKVLQLNLSEFPLKQKGKTFFAKIITSRLSHEISQQVGISHTIIEISPDTLYLSFEKKIDKKVPIVPLVSYKLAPQYSIDGAFHYTPKETIIHGSLDQVNAIDTLYSVEKSLTNLQKTYRTNLPLQLPTSSPALQVDDKNIEITIPVEQYTEATLSVPITLKNVPRNTKLEIIPQNATIVCNVGLTKFKQLTPDLFVIEADYKEHKRTKSKHRKQLSLKLKHYPFFVHNIRLKTPTIEVIKLDNHD